MRNIIIIIVLFSLIIFSSCTKIIDVKIDQGQTQLSVDGEITDDVGPYTVKLSKTQNYFDNVSTPLVKGAIVIIHDNEGIIDTLKEVSDGKYNTSKIQGKIGNKYTLNIKSLELGEFIAQTEIRRAFIFDTIYSIYEEDKFSVSNDKQYNVRYSYTDNKGVGDAVKVRVFLNDPSEKYYFKSEFHSDENVDGNHITDVKANKDALHVGDKITVKLYSITQDYYKFLTEVDKQMSNGGFFSDPPANVSTNILNINPKGLNGTGYFVGASVRKKTVTVKK